jgi:tetratricopeptide (TPR) repeat protein
MKLIYLIASLLVTGLMLDREPANTTSARAERGKTAVFCAPSFDPEKMNAANAPIFKGLGNLQYKITTRSARAQQYFNQGLTLIYAFNHGEAGRSFKAAIQADSACAMAWWGLAMVLGPNYNAALNPTSLQEIHDALDKAVKYSGKASANEQALIRALVRRFPREPVQDMSPFNAAYAAAMKEAHELFPNDIEIGAVYADALMNEHPWNLWLKDGSPQPWTPAITGLLEKMLRKSPMHAGLNHMYVHTIEASAEPGKGLAAANKLKGMLPAAGHLLHMPSHIYLRTGHYHEGVMVNEQASRADSSYIAQCKVQGTYPMMYYPHNLHFLAACAFMEGNSKKAIDAAWGVSRNANRQYLAENVSVQHFYSIPFYVLVHMGKWKEIMELPRPGASLKYPTAVWHYARGSAYAARNNRQEAQKELHALKEIAGDASLKSMLIWDMNSAYDLVQIAALVLEAQLLANDGKSEQAVALLSQAVDIEGNFMYQEPPDWFFSVRHTLGHVLVKAGRFAEAEKVYREDLQKYPENGWSLMGLYNSLKGQDKVTEAADVMKRFQAAWKHADIQINGSRVE